MGTIVIPDRLTTGGLNRLTRALDRAQIDENVMIDFGPQRHHSPRAILLLYRIISKMVRRKSAGTIRAINITDHSYLRHVGFFSKLGFEEQHGDLVATTPNYLPLHTINTQDWLGDLDFHELSSHIDQKSRRLSEILCQDTHKDEAEIIHFNLREIIRNTFEHTASTQIDILAQYWPKMRKAEIAIYDDGCGLLPTISRNRVLPVGNDLEAIKASILPGVSGSTRRRTGSEWDNSGFGLFMTSEICRRYGTFFIGSGCRTYEICGNRETAGNLQMSGTFVSLEFQLDNVARVGRLLPEIAADGERQAKLQFGKKARAASASSKGM